MNLNIAGLAIDSSDIQVYRCLYTTSNKSWITNRFTKHSSNICSHQLIKFYDNDVIQKLFSNRQVYGRNKIVINSSNTGDISSAIVESNTAIANYLSEGHELIYFRTDSCKTVESNKSYFSDTCPFHRFSAREQFIGTAYRVPFDECVSTASYFHHDIFYRFPTSVTFELQNLKQIFYDTLNRCNNCTDVHELLTKTANEYIITPSNYSEAEIILIIDNLINIKDTKNKTQIINDNELNALLNIKKSIETSNLKIGTYKINQ